MFTIHLTQPNQIRGRRRGSPSKVLKFRIKRVMSLAMEAYRVNWRVNVIRNNFAKMVGEVLIRLKPS